MTSINITIGANTAKFQEAITNLQQTVDQTAEKISDSFKNVGKAIDGARIHWEKFAAVSTAIRNTGRIVQELGSWLRTPLEQFSRFEDAATRTFANRYAPGRPPGDFRRLAHDESGGKQDGVRALLGNQKDVGGFRRRRKVGQGPLRRRLKAANKNAGSFSRRFKICTLQYRRTRPPATINELNRNIFRILNEADSKIFVILDNHPIPGAIGVLGALHKANVQIRRSTGNANCIIFPGINNFNPPVKLISNLFLRFK